MMPLRIEFELNDKQMEVLKEVLAIPQNAGQTENETCRILVVQCLINAKQQMVAAELSK